MGSLHEKTDRIEALRGLIERLSAPDLTLNEAKDLRERMTALLNRDDPSPAVGVPSLEIGDHPSLNFWAPEMSMRCAG